MIDLNIKAVEYGAVPAHMTGPDGTFEFAWAEGFTITFHCGCVAATLVDTEDYTLPDQPGRSWASAKPCQRHAAAFMEAFGPHTAH